jgi:hypothetical protein
MFLSCCYFDRSVLFHYMHLLVLYYWCYIKNGTNCLASIVFLSKNMCSLWIRFLNEAVSCSFILFTYKKSKVIPVRCQGSHSSLDNRLTHDSKVVSLTRRPPFPPHPPGRFMVLISLRGWVDPRAIVRLEELGQLKKKIHLIGTRTRDLPSCSIVPQPTTLSHGPILFIYV